MRRWQDVVPGGTVWIDLLLAQGRQVVGMDFRGHGLSGKPHDPSAYDGDQIPNDVLAVMDAVGLERTDVMGYSMGGLVAISLLARVPQVQFSHSRWGGVEICAARSNRHHRGAGNG